jgi:hypothetical protein
MKRIRFLLYYGKLRLTNSIGFHKTSNPLGIKWRWNYWQNRESSLRKRRH